MTLGDAFLSSTDFFSKSTFGKILSGIPPGCQTDWIQIRPDILLGLIWVQTVYKSYQLMTLGDKELSYFCYAFEHIYLSMPCGHLPGKGWPLGFRL